ncbi:hypothetical protein DS843_29795 [Roseomonas genomospecies 6]|uniref:Uncharacterized protein n=1 Tax=Roseomonas genomospecies 6 TaxID=214106 RepID=A0A9W7KN31_9PROT|nr:hypothetical protein DS843_29795 [Roseomonas genomospecies 6]
MCSIYVVAFDMSNITCQKRRDAKTGRFAPKATSLDITATRNATLVLLALFPVALPVLTSKGGSDTAVDGASRGLAAVGALIGETAGDRPGSQPL